jgi:tetratricopeptide (TPR) repeat protein
MAPEMSPLSRRWLSAAVTLLLFTSSAIALAQNRVSEAAPAPDDAPSVRVANAEAMARAKKFVEFGDARFREQKFSDAFQDYRKAAEAAPNLPDAYFRQALAQAALGRYAPAMKSVRRAALLDADWPKCTPRLTQLYGDNQAVKQMHFEQLATAVEKDLDNKDLMFLLAIELLCDDQPTRAKLFFKRAEQLGIEPNLVKPFLRVTSDGKPQDL